MRIWTGMSGWTHEPWKGDFYPKGLSAKKELEFASRQVSSIEVNGTFYALQKPSTFENWYKQTPDDFVFAIKAPRYITHIRRLKEFEEPLGNFLASGLFALKEKLGPILWQFPPNLSLKDERFELFAKALPRDPAAAVKASKKHSKWLKDRSLTTVKGVGELRHAFEFRHPSFANADFLKTLAKYNVAVVFAHAGENSLALEDSTADFVYARMHGEGKQFKKGYPPKELNALMDRLKRWNPKEAFVYFDTEAKRYSPKDARNFCQLVAKS